MNEMTRVSCVVSKIFIRDQIGLCACAAIQEVEEKTKTIKNDDDDDMTITEVISRLTGRHLNVMIKMSRMTGQSQSKVKSSHVEWTTLLPKK